MGKELDKAIDKEADRIPYGHLLASTDPASLMLNVARRLDVLEEVTNALEDVCKTGKVGWVQDAALKKAKSLEIA